MVMEMKSRKQLTAEGEGGGGVTKILQIVLTDGNYNNYSKAKK